MPDFRPALDGSAHGSPHDHVIVVGPNGQIGVPFLTLDDIDDGHGGHRHFLGVLDGVGVWALDVDEEPDGAALMPLIMSHGRLGDELWAIAGRAVQISAWWRTHQYCGSCGKPNQLRDAERAL